MANHEITSKTLDDRAHILNPELAFTTLDVGAESKLNWIVVVHSSNWVVVIHSSNWIAVVYSSNRIGVVHSSNWIVVVHSSNRIVVVHSSNWSDVVHSWIDLKWVTLLPINLHGSKMNFYTIHLLYVLLFYMLPYIVLPLPIYIYICMYMYMNTCY
jgi:hypothetical protein